MRYDSSPFFCRRCEPVDFEGEALQAHLDAYAASLPEDQRVPEAAYTERLAQCERCAHRIQYTCTLCGCYVQARAAKRRMRCPLTPTPMWSDCPLDAP